MKKYFFTSGFLLFLWALLMGVNQGSVIFTSDQMVSIQPDTKQSIPQRTICQVSYDEENIYFDWEAELYEGFSVQKKGKNDEFQDSDFLRAQITTLPDDAYCYVFYCYPDGSYMDAIRDQNFNVNNQWDCHYYAENRFENNTWYCRMVIPFRDLRYIGDAPYHWNMSFCRMYFNNNTIFSDPFLSISQMGRDYFKNGYPLEIHENLPVVRNIQIIPYYTPVADLKNNEINVEPDQFGLDLSYKPLSMLNFKVSMNPDFSDVPMDKVQNNYNLKNEPFYEENRYFFIEDLNAFDIDNDFFYSRRIIQPQIAGKLTGTNDQFNYGMMYCLDKNPENNEKSHYGLISFKPRWEGFELGTNVIYYKDNDITNQVIQLNPLWIFPGNRSIVWKNTYTLYEDSLNSKEGFDSYIQGFYRRDNWSSNIKAGGYTKDLKAVMGRIYDPGILYGEFNICYSDNAMEKFEDFELTFWLNPTWDLDQKLIKMDTGVYLKTDTRDNFYHDSNMSVNYLRENGKLFVLPQMRNYISYKFKQYDFYFGSMYSIGKDYHYDLEKKTGYMYAEPEIGWNPHHWLNFHISSLLFSYPWLNEEDQEIVDPFFHLINTEFKSYLTNQVTLTSGLRYSQYFAGEYGFYFNVNYEFNKDFNVYSGISKGEFYDDKKWNTDFSTSYLKLRLTYNF